MKNIVIIGVTKYCRDYWVCNCPDAPIHHQSDELCIVCGAEEDMAAMATVEQVAALIELGQ